MDQQPFGKAIRNASLGSNPYSASVPSKLTKRKKLGWGTAFLFGGSSMLLTIYSIASMQPNWAPPSQDALINVKGTFVGGHTNKYQPYTFRTDAGGIIQLGCEPQFRLVNCLKSVGTSPEVLAGVPVTVGYFRVHTPWWEGKLASWPNVLATVETRGKTILPYSTSRAWFERDYAIDQRESWIMIVLLPFAALFFYAAIKITVKKFKHEL